METSAVRISAGQRRRELVKLAKTVLLSGRDGSRAQASRHQRRSCSEPGCPSELPYVLSTSTDPRAITWITYVFRYGMNLL